MRSRLSKIVAGLDPATAREWGYRSTTEYVDRFNMTDDESVVDLQHLLRLKGKTHV